VLLCRQGVTIRSWDGRDKKYRQYFGEETRSDAVGWKTQNDMRGQY
jgi:hypothetical protein